MQYNTTQYNTIQYIMFSRSVYHHHHRCHSISYYYLQNFRSCYLHVAYCIVFLVFLCDFFFMEVLGSSSGRKTGGSTARGTGGYNVSSIGTSIDSGGAQNPSCIIVAPLRTAHIQTQHFTANNVISAKPRQELSSSGDGRPFSYNRHGPNIGAVPLLGRTRSPPDTVTLNWAEAYGCVKDGSCSSSSLE